MFVIQYHKKPWETKWYTYQERYQTVKEAQGALNAMPKIAQIGCRIAEEYTVVRYKAVKAA